MSRIKAVKPSMAVPGGTVRVEVESLGDPSKARVEVGGLKADMIGASSRHLTVRIPQGCGDGLVLSGEGEDQFDLKVGQVLTSELHSVANPVVDSSGNVYVTVSGARGEKVPFSIFVSSVDGKKDPFLADVINPTGLAIGKDNCLYITSRHTGTVYRSTFDKQIEKYVDGLGLATGLVFDSQQNLLVGDRGGKIYKITSKQEISVFCNLEPSVSAYHLAVSADDVLFVTGPTLATQDCIYRISSEGRSEVFFKGFGRPQGLGFDRLGNLQVVASWKGQKGLYTFTNGAPELTVAGPMLVGFAYNHEGNRLYLSDSTNLYCIDL
ncbi:MAG: gluconolaconase [Acidobacteriota bacterium]